MKKKQEQELVNWFGQPSRPMRHKIKGKPGSVNFLGLKSPKRVNFLGFGKSKGPVKNVNFLGLKSKNGKMKPSSLFLKESHKKKRLSKWGDVDMDGSPNYFDCDPRNPFKDQYMENTETQQLPKIPGPEAPPSAEELLSQVKNEKSQRSKNKQALLEVVGERIKSVEAQDIAKIKEDKAIRKQKLVEAAYKPYKALKELKGKIRRPTKALRRYAGLEGKEFPETKAAREKTKEAEQTRQELKQLEQELRVKGIEPSKDETYLALEQDTAIKEAKLAGYKTKVGKVSEESKQLMEALKTPGLAGTLKYQRYAVEEKMARGVMPTRKELKALAKSESKARLIGDIKQEGKISRDILSRTPVLQGARVFTGAGLGLGGAYTKEMRAKSARIRRMTATATRGLFGDALTQTRFDSEPRGRGRPAGPSGEYKIGGKPVYEAEFQQYAAKQNALNRMLPSQQQSATLNPEYVAYLKAQKAAERGETQTVYTEDGMPMEGIPQAEGAEGLPKMGTSMMQTGQQQIEMQQKRAYQRATPDEVKAAQYQAQAVDNPLMAPNFMKGELKAAGGSILTPIGPSILEAPQVFKGEMRNVTKTNPDEGEVKLSERPQTNPYGDEWLDIEIGSGKPVIRRRPREKWMTGEAL